MQQIVFYCDECKHEITSDTIAFSGSFGKHGFGIGEFDRKDTSATDSWHFCSSSCVSVYAERFMKKLLNERADKERSHANGAKQSQ